MDDISWLKTSIETGNRLAFIYVLIAVLLCWHLACGRPTVHRDCNSALVGFTKNVADDHGISEEGQDLSSANFKLSFLEAGRTTRARSG